MIRGKSAIIALQANPSRGNQKSIDSENKKGNKHKETIDPIVLQITSYSRGSWEGMRIDEKVLE
jgi:hypothetical protein